LSKTVRISDTLYQAINEAKTENQTFEEFIEEMANEYGLLPEGIQSQKTLEQKLANIYGFQEPEVQDIVTTLKAIYIGDETDHTIGYPHAEAEERYGRDNITILKRLGLVRENHYTGKYEFGYETTGTGEKTASDIVINFLKQNKKTITGTLAEYDERLLSFLLHFGFERTDSGRYSSRGASLSFPGNSIFNNETIQDEYDQLKQDLVDLGVAVRHSEGSFVIFPPEFPGFIGGMTDDFHDIMERVEVYKVILDFVNDDLTTRGEILDQINLTSETRLQQIINELHDEGLTSKYVQKDTPFLVKDRESLFEYLENQLVDDLR
jgi:hypothetical protein